MMFVAGNGSLRESVAQNAFEIQDMVAFMTPRSLLQRACEDICQPKRFWMRFCLLRGDQTEQDRIEMIMVRQEIETHRQQETESQETSFNIDVSDYDTFILRFDRSLQNFPDAFHSKHSRLFSCLAHEQ